MRTVYILKICSQYTVCASENAICKLIAAQSAGKHLSILTVFICLLLIRMLGLVKHFSCCSLMLLQDILLVSINSRFKRSFIEFHITYHKKVKSWQLNMPLNPLKRLLQILWNFNLLLPTFGRFFNFKCFFFQVGLATSFRLHYENQSEFFSEQIRKDYTYNTSYSRPTVMSMH